MLSNLMTTNTIYAYFQKLQTLSARKALLVAVMLEMLIFGADLLTGIYIPFGSYYLLPISFAAWCLGIWPVIFFILASGLLRHYALSDLFPPGSSIVYFAGNMATAIFIYSLVAFLLIQLKRAYQELASYAHKLEGKVERAEKREKMDSSIRRAVVDDVEAIIELTAMGAEDGDLSKEVTTLVRQQALRDIFMESIREGMGPRPTWTGEQATVPVEFWVADAGGRIAGFFMIMGLDQKHGSERELHAIAVAREYRGMGVGTAMVDFFCAHYCGRRLYAACMPNSTMRHMLKRRGFYHYANSKEGHVIVERVEWPKEKGLLKEEALAA